MALDDHWIILDTGHRHSAQIHIPLIDEQNYPPSNYHSLFEHLGSKQSATHGRQTRSCVQI